MFGLSRFKDYGLKIITWDFGTGKTKNIYQDAFLWKKQYPDWLLIANVPYDFVDIHFSTKTDLDKILDYISLYIAQSNWIDRLKAKDFPLIRIIIDEAHLYFFSRDFKWLNKQALLILTQCRKRYIQVDLVTQELAQIDIFIRRLMPYVQNYTKFIFGFQRSTMYYFKVAEMSDIGDEFNVEELETEYIFPDRIQKFFNPDLEKYFSQKHLSLYVIGKNDILTDYSFVDFMEKIEKKRALFLFYQNLSLRKKNGMNNKNNFSQPKKLQSSFQSSRLIDMCWFRSHKINTSTSMNLRSKWVSIKNRFFPRSVDKSDRVDSVQELHND